MSIGYLFPADGVFVQIVSKSPPPLPPPRISRSSELIINISRLIKHLIDHPSACVTHNTPLQYFLSWRLELETKVNEVFTITQQENFIIFREGSFPALLVFLH